MIQQCQNGASSAFNVDAREVVGSCHDNRPSHVEEAVNGNGFPPPIVQHHGPSKKSAEKGTDLCRPNHPFLSCFGQVKFIPDVEQSTTNEP